jgi:hypothetical protein
MTIAEEKDRDPETAIDERRLLKMVNEMNQVLGSEAKSKLPKSMCEFHASMVKHQEETRTLLVGLNANVKKLVDVSERKFASRPENDSTECDQDPSQLLSSKNTAADNEMALARTTVRLDGLEVYAVVSALTCATLYQCFESFNGDDWGMLFNERRFIELFADAIFLLSSATGILAGLHSTLVFSLMTMYGRTAIGMGQDEAFITFFKKTGSQRFRGFQTFLWSLYAFLVQVVIMITSKAAQSTRLILFLGIGYFMYIVYKDTQSIVDNAGIIFAPRTSAKDKKKSKKKSN